MDQTTAQAADSGGEATVGPAASPAAAPVSVVVLTFNAESTLAATLAAARQVSDDIHVIDSGSTDATLDIARDAGARIVTHPFEHYGAQRNWAIDTLKMRHGWELHLDADERLSDELAEYIRILFADLPEGIDGYYIPRLVHFLGRPIRHGGMYPIWHMRLFRRGKGRCENRRYDQHFYVDGLTGRLPYPMIDDIRIGIDEFMARHNRWANAEVDELMMPSVREGVIAGRFGGSPVERKRKLRSLYNRSPLFLRAIALFLYRYILRGGFRDGREGLLYFLMQTLVYRLIVDAKLLERRLTAITKKA